MAGDLINQSEEQKALARRNVRTALWLALMAFGFVAASALEGDAYFLNPSGTALVGRKKRKSYALNARLQVVVSKVDRYKRLIDFKPA